MGLNRHAHWGTEEEVKFIAGCGTGKWSAAPHMKATPRRTILVNLREAYASRTDWTNIDKKLVMAFLNSEIKKEK